MIIDRPTRGNVQEYVEHLKKHDTSMVVRVCEPTYDDGVFEKEGIIVHVSTTVTPITINKLCVQGPTVQGPTVQGSTVLGYTVQCSGPLSRGSGPLLLSLNNSSPCLNSRWS